MSELHCEGLARVAIDAGLSDITDPVEFLRERGICVDCIDHYAQQVVSYAMSADDELAVATKGIFHTGLTLGLAIAEARR